MTPARPASSKLLSLRTFFTLLLLAALAIGGWLGWALWIPVRPEGQKFVLLRPGYSTWRIATELKSAEVIHSANAFVVWHYFHHKHSLKAGEYLFDRSATAINVHDRVARGDIYVHTLVIPEGYTIFDIAQAVQDAGLGSKQEFLQLATADTALISDLAPNAKSLEGYLFPATYEFTRTQNNPRLDYRERDSGIRGTSACGQRLLQPVGPEHRATSRSQRDLRGTACRNLWGSITSRRPANQICL